MTTQKVIQAGYEIEVKSWENDGDNYNTKSIQGYNKADTAFIVEFVRLYSSKNARPNGGFGNMGDWDNQEPRYAAEKAVVVKHKDTSAFARAIFDKEEENPYYELFGASDTYQTRVLEYVKVFYHPEDVVIDEVTEEFTT